MFVERERTAGIEIAKLEGAPPWEPSGCTSGRHAAPASGRSITRVSRVRGRRGRGSDCAPPRARRRNRGCGDEDQLEHPTPGPAACLAAKRDTVPVDSPFGSWRVSPTARARASLHSGPQQRNPPPAWPGGCSVPAAVCLHARHELAGRHGIAVLESARRSLRPGDWSAPHGPNLICTVSRVTLDRLLSPRMPAWQCKPRNRSGADPAPDLVASRSFLLMPPPFAGRDS